MASFRLKRYPEAVSKFRAAADTGHLASNFNLAQCLHDGIGVKCDPGTAKLIWTHPELIKVWQSRYSLPDAIMAMQQQDIILTSLNLSSECELVH